MTTAQTTDIRIAAWSFARRSQTLAVAYRRLENGHADAVRVFAALSANEWGVEAAFASGLRGEDIVTQADAVTQVAFTGGEPFKMEPLRRPSDFELAFRHSA